MKLIKAILLSLLTVTIIITGLFVLTIVPAWLSTMVSIIALVTIFTGFWYKDSYGEPQDKGEISDGYHTFNELYYYRMLYNAAFFNMLPKEWVHKSKRHHDGEECFGGCWFVVMANLPTGQISNHYELKDWNLFQIPEKEVADKWDGHTPQEAADRLHKYLLEKQGEQKPIDYNKELKKCRENPLYFFDKYVKLKLKKPAKWSEEDDKMLEDIIASINHESIIEGLKCRGIDHSLITSTCLMKDLIAWLKSLKERVQLQPKQEWSEEDEKMLNSFLHKVEVCDLLTIKENHWIVKKLKLLRPQKQWKPTQEQLDALKWQLENVSESAWQYKATEELYNQLKEL